MAEMDINNINRKRRILEILPVLDLVKTNQTAAIIVKLILFFQLFLNNSQQDKFTGKNYLRFIL
jgi:hypothetical protein